MMSKTERKALTDLSESLCKVCGPKLAAWLDGHKAKPKRAKQAVMLKDGEVSRAAFVRALTECAKVARRAMGGYGESAVRVAFASLTGGTLRMRATDGEVFVSRDFAGAVAESGHGSPERVLDAAPMLRWIKTRKDKALCIDVGEGVVGLRVGDVGAAFAFLPTPEDDGPFLPPPPDGDWTTLATMPAAEAVSMFRRTAFAASDKELRYAMNGVFLNIRGKKGKRSLEAVATDGRRLAVVGPLKADGKGEALVPLAGVASIRGLFHGNDSDVSLAVASVGGEDSETGLRPTFFRAESPRASVVARCVDGRFPAYHEVIPKSLPLKVVADKAALAGALKAANAFRGEERRAVVLEVGEGGIVLYPSNEEHRDKRFKAPARVEGEMELKAGWNADYILDALRVVDDGDVTLEFSDNFGSTMVLSQGNLRYILMDVTIRDEPDEESA